MSFRVLHSRIQMLSGIERRRGRRRRRRRKIRRRRKEKECIVRMGMEKSQPSGLTYLANRQTTVSYIR